MLCCHWVYPQRVGDSQKQVEQLRLHPTLAMSCLHTLVPLRLAVLTGHCTVCIHSLNETLFLRAS